MQLKSTVDGLLKEKNRSLSWLAEEMGKTFDGLKLSLVKGSIKYNDLIEMAKKLEVSPTIFFDQAANRHVTETGVSILAEPREVYGEDLKGNLRNCRELLATLKDQIKDKEKIISLLSARPH
ncbi:MAG: hypothetical protein V4594_19020 [Bacteroidota bacterium]